MMAMFAGANVINLATGWLEDGLVTSFEKTMIDADLCGKIARFFDGIDLAGNTQAMSAIAATGPGQHFLGSEHTHTNFLSALFRPETPDNSAFEQWQAADEQDPGPTPATNAGLQDYIARCKAEKPDMNYF